MNMLIPTQNETMTSLEIAEVVDKRHDNVKRTIETLASKGLIRFTQIEETSHEGAGARPVTVYQVNERDSYVVVAQLSPEFTARLVDYWQAHRNQVPQTLTTTETLIQMLQLQAANERKQAQQQKAIEAITSRVDQIEDTAPLKSKPQNTAAITEIRSTMNKRYGLSERIVNEVMTQLPQSPTIFAMVKNSNEHAQGSSFAVYLNSRVNKVFARFISECTRVSKTKVTHPDIEGSFKMVTA